MKRNIASALKASVDAQSEADKGRFGEKVAKAEVALAAMHEADKPRPRPCRSKVVRDTFTMPPTEHDQLGDLRSRAVALGVVATKSQLVRAGLQLLGQASDKALVDALGALEYVPTGRPSGNGTNSTNR
jgi:hypothetical protein